MLAACFLSQLVCIQGIFLSGNVVLSLVSLKMNCPQLQQIKAALVLGSASRIVFMLQFKFIFSASLSFLRSLGRSFGGQLPGPALNQHAESSQLHPGYLVTLTSVNTRRWLLGPHPQFHSLRGPATKGLPRLKKLLRQAGKH